MTFRHIPVTPGGKEEDQKIVIPAGTPITQFLPEGGIEIREFSPDILDALDSIGFNDRNSVPFVVSKIMGKAPSFVKDFTKPKESPDRERIPGLILEHDVQIQVKDGKLKLTELIRAGTHGPIVPNEL